MCVSYLWHVCGLFAGKHSTLSHFGLIASSWRLLFLGRISSYVGGVEGIRNVRRGWTSCCALGVTEEIPSVMALYVEIWIYWTTGVGD